MTDAITANQANSQIGSGRNTLVSNFETFLALLTTQLRNQDPLSPVDSNEFTAQLTQMAGVEQQLLTNDLLTSLLQATAHGGLAGASDYLGKDATAAWSAVRFEDGKASWSYELASEAADVTLKVVDASGNVVWSGDAPEKGTGLHSFEWDGKTNTGGQAEEGSVYSLEVEAKTGAGDTVAAQALVVGRVTGVEMYDGQPYLIVGSSILPASSVISLSTPKTDDGPEQPDEPEQPTEPAA